MSSPYQVRYNSNAAHQYEGLPSPSGAVTASDAAQQQQIQLQPLVGMRTDPAPAPTIAIGIQPDPNSTLEHQPLSVVPSYPAQQQLLPQPLSRDVLLTMSVRIGFQVRVMIVLMVISWAALTTLAMQFMLPTGFEWVWVFYPVFSIALIVWKLPVRCEVSQYGVTVHTRFTNYLLPFSRMTSIHVVRSSCCWMKDCCTFPRSSFTSTSDGVFFRGDSCGTSIGFSPFDIEQFVHILKQTSAAQKIVEE